MARHTLSSLICVMISPLIGSCGGTDPELSSYTFAEGFEFELSGYVGKFGELHHGVIVEDPLRRGNRVVHFTDVNEAGDLFGPKFKIDSLFTYRVQFEYLGLPEEGSVPGDLGGVIGFSTGTPGQHIWIAGTRTCCAIDDDLLIDDGQWHTYQVDVDFFKRLYTDSIRLMLEDYDHSLGVAGDAYFDNISVEQLGPS